MMLFLFMQPLFDCFAAKQKFEFAPPQNVGHLKWVKIVQICHVHALTIAIIILVSTKMKVWPALQSPAQRLWSTISPSSVTGKALTQPVRNIFQIIYPQLSFSVQYLHYLPITPARFVPQIIWFFKIIQNM